MSSADAVAEGVVPADERLGVKVAQRRPLILRRRGWLVRRALLAADGIGLVTAVVLTELLPLHSAHRGTLDRAQELALFLLTLPLWIVAAKIHGLYDRDEERTDHSTPDDLPGILHVVTLGTWLVCVLAWATRVVEPDWTKLVVFWFAAIAVITTLRSTARAVCRRHANYLQNTAIVGWGAVGQLVARKILAHPEYGLNLVGFVDVDPRQSPDDLDHVAHLGGGDDIVAVVELLDVERVIFAFSRQCADAEMRQLRELASLGVQVDVVPRLFERIGAGLSVHHVEGLPLLALPPVHLGRSSLALKRVLDVAGATLLLLLTLPLLVAVGVAVATTSRGRVFYSDRRVGRSGRIFGCLKFRTMRVNARELLDEMLAANQELRLEFELNRKLAIDPRVTRVGRILRRCSLDELPQLINVLRGDLSLVGPRPITLFEYERFRADIEAGDTEYYWDSGLRPGLTGYWQISGRSSMSYAERVRLDRAYTASWSVGLDFMILAKTLRTIWSRVGAT